MKKCVQYVMEIAYADSWDKHGPWDLYCTRQFDMMQDSVHGLVSNYHADHTGSLIPEHTYDYDALVRLSLELEGGPTSSAASIPLYLYAHKTTRKRNLAKLASGIFEYICIVGVSKDDLLKASLSAIGDMCVGQYRVIRARCKINHCDDIYAKVIRIIIEGPGPHENCFECQQGGTNQTKDL